MQSVHPDHDGVVRDVIVRYSLLKPGPEPYITAFTKKGPFKTKLCSVQTRALMYSKEEQMEDMQTSLKISRENNGSYLNQMTATEASEDSLDMTQERCTDETPAQLQDKAKHKHFL